MEHSGTTFLSKLLTVHPRVNTAFECGVLDAKSPSEIPNLVPWGEWFTLSCQDGHWGLSDQQLQDVAAAKDWNSAYTKLIEHSPFFREEEDYIVDKSPKYLRMLDQVLPKIPGKPVLVLEKDALLLYHSYKRREYGLDRFIDYFNKCQTQLRQAEESGANPILRVSQERLSRDQSGLLIDLCEYLGLNYLE